MAVMSAVRVSAENAARLLVMFNTLDGSDLPHLEEEVAIARGWSHLLNRCETAAQLRWFQEQYRDFLRALRGEVDTELSRKIRDELLAEGYEVEN